MVKKISGSKAFRAYSAAVLVTGGSKTKSRQRISAEKKRQRIKSNRVEKTKRCEKYTLREQTPERRCDAA